MADPVVLLDGGSRTVQGGVQVLRDVGLRVAPGESVAIIGRSGSGKSTLLAGLGLLAPFDHDSVYRLAGVDARTLRERDAAKLRAHSIGFVLQNSGLIAHLSAIENVRVPLMHTRSVSTRQAKRRAVEALDRLGIAHLGKRRPSQVSGGERQRIAIARALVVAPSLILADEPTGALDEVTGGKVLDQMLELVEGSGSALIVVTHDHDVAARMQRTYRLDGGSLHAVDRRSA